MALIEGHFVGEGTIACDNCPEVDCPLKGIYSGKRIVKPETNGGTAQIITHGLSKLKDYPNCYTWTGDTGRVVDLTIGTNGQFGAVCSNSDSTPVGSRTARIDSKTGNVIKQEGVVGQRAKDCVICPSNPDCALQALYLRVIGARLVETASATLASLTNLPGVQLASNVPDCISQPVNTSNGPTILTITGEDVGENGETARYTASCPGNGTRTLLVTKTC